MSRSLRWGILGTGNIACKFAGQLGSCPRGELVAVGSRSIAAADAFVDECGGLSCSYDQLLKNADVEAVYISLPNSLHHEWTIRALEAGKHVLCEKPIAANAAEAQEMFDVAERTGRVLVEAFMYRCHPAIERLLQTVRDGAIGQLKLIRTHFTFNREMTANDVRMQPELAGGSLMDVGCYCVNLGRAIVGSEPTGAHAVAHHHETGVDDYASGVLNFGGEVLAVFTCGMTVEQDRTTFVGGSQGYIAMDTPWFSDGSFRIVRGNQDEIINVPSELPSYALEADRFARVVRDGDTPWTTKEDSLGNMHVLDQLRSSAGLPY